MKLSKKQCVNHSKKSTISSKKVTHKRDLKSYIRSVSIALPLLLINFYRVVISPHTPSSCRFVPTCSQYALEAYKKYGLFKGTYLTAKRILRCHPWGGSGYDPLP